MLYNVSLKGLAAAAVLLLGANAASAAQVYLGVHGGGNFTHEGDFNGVGDLSYEPGYAAGVVAGFAWDQALRTEVEFTYRENDFDELDTSVGSFDVDGDLTSVALMGNVFYDFRSGSPWVPYAGGGLGAAIVTFDSAAHDSDTVFAFQLGAGVGYEINPAITLSLDYRFFGTEDPEFDDGGRFDLEYLNSSLWFGLRYNF